MSTVKIKFVKYLYIFYALKVFLVVEAVVEMKEDKREIRIVFL